MAAEMSNGSECLPVGSDTQTHVRSESRSPGREENTLASRRDRAVTPDLARTTRDNSGVAVMPPIEASKGAENSSFYSQAKMPTMGVELQGGDTRFWFGPEHDQRPAYYFIGGFGEGLANIFGKQGEYTFDETKPAHSKVDQFVRSVGGGASRIEISNLSNTPNLALKLAEDIDAGRHIIIVSHSQGNEQVRESMAPVLAEMKKEYGLETLVTVVALDDTNRALNPNIPIPEGIDNWIQVKGLGPFEGRLATDRNKTRPDQYLEGHSVTKLHHAMFDPEVQELIREALDRVTNHREAELVAASHLVRKGGPA